MDDADPVRPHPMQKSVVGCGIGVAFEEIMTRVSIEACTAIFS